jgi:hypothetical protein
MSDPTIVIFTVCMLVLVSFFVISNYFDTKETEQILKELDRTTQNIINFAEERTTTTTTFVDPWYKFIDEFEEWAKECPLEMSDRARLLHLQEEVIELLEKPYDDMEMADIGLILLKHCFAYDVDLLLAMQVKFNLIKNSKWSAPDENGIVRRIKD